MKNLKIENQDTFQLQLKKFKRMLVRSKINKIFIVLGICISFLLMFNSEKDVLVIASLLLGVAVIVGYTFKFLSLKTIEQESYTKTSLKSSVLKFKTYIKTRKKYEIFYTSIWVLSLIPFKIFYSGSVIKAIIEILWIIAMGAYLNMLIFKKEERDLKNLEAVMQQN